jgi:hypothetical protein
VDDSTNVSRLKPMLSKGGRQNDPVVFVNHGVTLSERMECDQPRYDRATADGRNECGVS